MYLSGQDNVTCTLRPLQTSGAVHHRGLLELACNRLHQLGVSNLPQSVVRRLNCLQGLTNADGSVKTECGIHTVTDEVPGMDVLSM